MPVILLTTHYSESPLKIIQNEIPPGFTLLTLDQSSKQELVEKARQADYLLVSGRMSIDREVLDAATNLKMIQRTGVGTDTLDLETIKKKKIPVYVNYGVNARSVAEHTLMLILSLLRRLHMVDASVKRGVWNKHELGMQCNELYQKTVGLIGMGKIAMEVTKLLNAFGANILYYKPARLHPDEERKFHISYCDLPKMLPQVDILSIHCALNASTEKMIGKQELASLKQGAIIINTSRGRLIDEDALVESIQAGHIRGAGLDVFAEEPIPPNHNLLKLDQVILTPHIGGVTLEAFRSMMKASIHNIQQFEQGQFASIRDKALLV